MNVAALVPRHYVVALLDGLRRLRASSDHVTNDYWGICYNLDALVPRCGAYEVVAVLCVDWPLCSGSTTTVRFQDHMVPSCAHPIRNGPSRWTGEQLCQRLALIDYLISRLEEVA